jgi:hypothetical protein
MRVVSISTRTNPLCGELSTASQREITRLAVEESSQQATQASSVRSEETEETLAKALFKLCCEKVS